MKTFSIPGRYGIKTLVRCDTRCCNREMRPFLCTCNSVPLACMTTGMSPSTQSSSKASPSPTPCEAYSNSIPYKLSSQKPSTKLPALSTKTRSSPLVPSSSACLPFASTPTAIEVMWPPVNSKSGAVSPVFPRLKFKI